eukprot:scaffold315452_cov27-Tisochrysis_lutea.AAC.8
MSLNDARFRSGDVGLRERSTEQLLLSGPAWSGQACALAVLPHRHSEDLFERLACLDMGHGT